MYSSVHLEQPRIEIQRDVNNVLRLFINLLSYLKSRKQAALRSPSRYLNHQSYTSITKWISSKVMRP
uniref:Uncharacterized protein n=1 Tax=Lepeophtheirus salmonis TaxID=72036 RepID=A0A0K2URA2_LEPSM